MRNAVSELLTGDQNLSESEREEARSLHSLVSELLIKLYFEVHFFKRNYK